MWLLGDPEHACSCSPMVIRRYQKRLSGPLLDRIDIHVEVPRVPFQKLTDERRGEPSAASRARQSARFANLKDGQGAGLTTNVNMGPTQVRDHCPVDETGRHTKVLGAAMRQMNLSARAYHRVLELGTNESRIWRGVNAHLHLRLSPQRRRKCPAGAHRGGDPVSAEKDGVSGGGEIGSWPLT